MINLDIMPPDWRFAQNHAKALKPGITQSLTHKKGTHTFCKCCLNPIQKELVPMCSNSKQLEFLGFGFPLYFIFLKYCMILVLILICSYSAVSLYWGINHNYALCTKHRLLSASEAQGDTHCTSFLIIFARIQQQVDGAQMILRIASFFIHLTALVYVRDNVKKTIQYYDEKTTSLSDYSFLIKHLPMKQNIQKNIEDFVHHHFEDKWKQLEQQNSDQGFKKEKKVMEILLLPDLKEFYQLEKQKNKILQEKREILKKIQKFINNKVAPHQNRMLSQTTFDLGQQANSNQQTQLQKINQRLHNKQAQITNWCQNHRKLIEQDKLPAQKAIVTLNQQIFKNTILQYAEQNQLNTDLVGKYFGPLHRNITLEQSHQPNQIIWQNVNYTSKDRLIGRTLGWLFTVIFIAIATVGFYFILVAKTNNLLHAIQESHSKQELSHDSKYQVAVFLVFFDIVLIVLFNKLVMGWALHHFTHIEKHTNTSDEEFWFAIKYTVGLFFTTALMTLAVQAITFHNFYAHQYGVIQQQSIMFFINSFFVPLIWILNPWQVYHQIQRFFKKGKPYFTQKQANKIMSDNKYTMGKRYAQIIQTMWFTFFYATMIPLGSFITFFGLVLYYWVDKFNLLRRSSLPNNISAQMAVYSLKLLDFTLILKPIGQLMFDSQMRHHTYVQSIVLICIGFVYLILPINKLLQFFHDESFKQQQKSYQSVKDLFLQTYQTLHPIMNHKTSGVFQRMQRRVTKKLSLTQLNPQEMTKIITKKFLPQLKKNKETQPSLLALNDSPSKSMVGL